MKNKANFQKLNKIGKRLMPLPPDVVAARSAFDTLERELIFGLSRSYKFYKTIRETVCPYDPVKMMHRMDFRTDRYNILYRAIDAYYRRFDNVELPPAEMSIPSLVLSAYVVDWANRERIAPDVATEIIDEINAEAELTHSFNYESVTALANSAPFTDWLTTRILEQTFGQISAQKNLGYLTIETLSESVEQAKEFVSKRMGFAQRILERRFRQDIEIHPPVVRYFIGDAGVATPGNLATVSGQSKTGKTAITVAMIASTFAPRGADCLGFTSSNPNGHAVIYIDTEQSRFDNQELMRMAARRAGVPLPTFVSSYCLTGHSPSEIRQSIPFILDQAKKECGGIHSLILDGVADAASDVNDQAEANAIVAELHGLAIKYDCSIVLCIHLNPGKDVKMRGHLGSQCERKAETNLKIVKDSDEVSLLYADKNRRSPIPKQKGPRFKWNSDVAMHASIVSLGIVNKEKALAELLQLFNALFQAGDSASYGDLTKSIIAYEDRSESTAQRRIADAVEAGIIRKNAQQDYELTTPITFNRQTTLN